MTQYSGVFTLPQQAQALTSGQWATDPYFKNTTLLLHADGIPGGAQNNTFLDSSSNAFTITRNGNTTQGTFSPYMPNGYWANYFDGSGDYLSATRNDSLAFGTGAFTTEFWIFPTIQDSTNRNIVDNRIGENANAFTILINNGYPTVFTSTPVLTSSTIAPINTWSHVAVVGNGGANGSRNVKMYLNGALVGTWTTDYNFTVFNLVIGDYYGAPSIYEFAGYISNIRIVKGTAVYTSNFTPSTAPLTAISGTSLLTCQSNRFLDNSTNAFTVTPAGNVAVQQFQPFMRPYQYSTSVIGGSGYFDGTGDYLDSPSNAALTATGDFTFECWVYITNSSTQYQGFFSTRPLGTSTGIALTKADTNFEGWVNGSVIGTTPIIYNAWVHLAIARSGSGSNNIAFWVNGVRIGTLTNTSSTSTSTATIGRYYYDIANYYFGGYLSGARMINGTAVYNPSSSTITIPTAPLTAVSNTSLLCNFTNAGIYDNAMQNNLETVGNAQVSTSVVKYGSGSMYFDGSGDWLLDNSLSPSYDFGSGDFTIEGWLYPTTSGIQMMFVNLTPTSGSPAATSFSYFFRITSANKLDFTLYSSSTSYAVTDTSNMPVNTWTHVAVTRASGTLRLFNGGVLVATTAANVAINASDNTRRMQIGTYNLYGQQDEFQGYIDDLRITKGVARYTSNFQPPQVAFANQ